MRVAFPMLFLAGCAASLSEPPPRIEAAELERHVRILSDDRLAGRAPGTEGETIATDYIAAQFAEAGVEALFGGDYFQRFVASKDGQIVSSRNVAGIVPGTARPNEYLVLVAHHDGQGQCIADAAGDDICNSAVDNASGVAVLLELAEEVAAAPLARSVVFLATGAEEWGLQGAQAFLAAPPFDLASVSVVIGFDTPAARGRTTKVGLLGDGLTDLDPVLKEVAAARGRKLDTRSDAEAYYYRSDHFAFAKAGIPAIVINSLFADEAPDPFSAGFMAERYHGANDEADAIETYDGAIADAELVLDLIRVVAARDGLVNWKLRAPFRRP